ncbi:hypothetical protein AURDEDRAFT_185118 [Auricularia subglabra TFB-10046 SS5]|nr:hypothetical protein AURDEDRAFT_185118 [Auricularia subglabra TFB-10046 SS5]
MYANHEAPHPARVSPYPAPGYPARAFYANPDTFPIIMYKPPGADEPPPPPPDLPSPKHKICRILQYDAERMEKRLKRKRDGETTYDFHRLTSAILLNQLKNGDKISVLYTANGGQPTVDYQYEPADEAQQAAAQEMLHAHSLDEDREKARADKLWTIMWKQASTKERPRSLTRLLLQCPCGYEHVSKYHPSVFAYTGCLAHAEITMEEPSKRVLRIRGHLEHNSACVETKARVAQTRAELPDGGQQPRRPPRKRNRKPKASTSSTPTTVVIEAHSMLDPAALEPEAQEPVAEPTTHAEGRETLDEPPTDGQQLDPLQHEEQQLDVLQPSDPQHEMDVLHDPEPQQMFMPDYPPQSPQPQAAQVPYFSMQLSYLRGTLDNVTAYLASLPASDPNASEEVRLALASADALAAQLRRLAQ